jgi:hypothetical protein
MYPPLIVGELVLEVLAHYGKRQAFSYRSQIALTYDPGQRCVDKFATPVLRWESQATTSLRVDSVKACHPAFPLVTSLSR